MNHSDGHPAWQEILDKLPESLHSVIKPTLQKWDEGVNKRFAEIHAKYDPYKELVENSVDPDLIRTGINLAVRFQNEPEVVVQQAIEAFELGYVTQDQYEQALNQNDSSSYDPDDSEILNDPRFKQMEELVSSMKDRLDKDEQERLQASEQSKLDKTLEKLKEEHGDFDTMFVMTMIANGMDGATAVKQYQDTIDQAVAARLETNSNDNHDNNNGDTPVVLGNGQGGGSGSGLPDNPVQLGDMKTSDINQLVEQMLAQSKDQE